MATLPWPENSRGKGCFLPQDEPPQCALASHLYLCRFQPPGSVHILSQALTRRCFATVVTEGGTRRCETFGGSLGTQPTETPGPRWSPQCSESRTPPQKQLGRRTETWISTHSSGSGEEPRGGTSGRRASPGGCVAEKQQRRSIALRSQGFLTPLLSFPHFPTASLGVDFRCDALPFPSLSVSEGGVFVSSC